MIACKEERILAGEPDQAGQISGRKKSKEVPPVKFPRKFPRGIALAVVVMLAAATSGAQQKSTVVKGWVLDSACAFTKNLKKPISRECALSCAKAGSPLVILADDGTIDWPISDAMPATGQNPRLMEFAGLKVTVKGKVFERSGSRAIVIEQIEAGPASK
jgi:hypothetical protein